MSHPGFLHSMFQLSSNATEGFLQPLVISEFMRKETHSPNQIKQIAFYCIELLRANLRFERSLNQVFDSINS